MAFIGEISDTVVLICIRVKLDLSLVTHLFLLLVLRPVLFHQ